MLAPVAMARRDLTLLVEYAVAVRAASRVGREPAPDADAVTVDPDRARWWRLAVTHAADRLAAGGASLAEAAWGGLQDSAPRAGLLALHARADGVAPDAWEAPELAQVWLRQADHLVPREDAGVFTVGARPRDPTWAGAVDSLADAALAALPAPGAAGRRDTRAVANALPELPAPVLLRAVGVSGRVLIRWDTRTTELVPVELPGCDPAEARRELARRFLHRLGPAGAAHFARWAGVPRADAAATWDELDAAGELAPVAMAVPGRSTGRGAAGGADRAPAGRHVLAADLDGVLAAGPPSGVRLLPAGDPVLTVPVPAPPEPPVRAPGGDVTSRVVNGLTGRIVVDGDVVGAWGRAARDVTLDAWPGLGPADRPAVEEEAHGLAGPLGGDVRLRWLPPRRP
jgi:Winged helix DNA-binding domain